MQWRASSPGAKYRMPVRIDPESLEVIPSDLIKPGHAAWFDHTKTIFMLQPFDSNSAIPQDRVYGVYVNPSSYKDFMDRLLRGEFTY